MKIITVPLVGHESIEVKAYFPHGQTVFAVHKPIRHGAPQDGEWTITHAGTGRRVMPQPCNPTKRADAFALIPLLQPSHEAWNGNDDDVIMRRAEPLFIAACDAARKLAR